MSQKYVIDKCVGLTALKMYVMNANMEVGQVTVRHSVFAELIVQMKAGMCMDDAKAVFQLCFGNHHGGEKYISPLGDIKYSDDNIAYIGISPRLATLVYKACKTMEINKENVLAACDDLITCGRMYQEMTIDAAKNMYDVNIPYGKDMSHCHLLSRDNEDTDIGIRCDWKKKSEEANEELREEIKENKKRLVVAKHRDLNTTWKSYKNVQYLINEKKSYTAIKKSGKKLNKVRHVADFMQQLRCMLIERGKFFADDMMSVEQTFPEDFKAEIHNVTLARNMQKGIAITRFYHDVFRTVVNYKNTNIAAARKKYPLRSTALEEKIKEIKGKAQEAYKGITNQLRLEFDKLGVPVDRRIYLLLSEALESNETSSFSHIILPEEFLLMVMDFYKDDETVPKFTEDKLITCTFEEGETVDFTAGYAEKDGKIAKAEALLEGEFLIRKNKFGKFVASRCMKELITIPEPDPTQLCFLTKAGGSNDKYTNAQLEKVSMDMAGNIIKLIPYGNGLHDSIVVNDKEVGHFRCTPNLDKKITCETERIYRSAINNVFKNKGGKLKSFLPVDTGEKTGKVAVVILKEVEEVEVPQKVSLLTGKECVDTTEDDFEKKLEELRQKRKAKTAA